MRKIYLLVLGLIIATPLVHAKNFKLLIQGEGGDESGIDLNYPFYIDNDQRWRGQIGLYSNKYDKVEALGSKKFEGKKTTQMDEKNIYLSLSYVKEYKDALFSFGAEYEQFSQENKQFGYYQDKIDYLPYDNSINIKGNKINMVVDATYSSDNVNMRVSTTMTPLTNIEIEQETKIFPNLYQNGVLKSDASLGVSYLIEGEIKVDLGAYIDIGVEGSYGLIPYDYQLKIVNATRDGYVETTQKYDEKRSKIFGKIFIKKWLSDDIFPTIGFGRTEIKRDDESTTQNLVLFGLEKWF